LVGIPDGQRDARGADAAMQARTNLLAVAASDQQSPVHGVAADQIEFTSGKISAKSSPGKAEDFRVAGAAWQISRWKGNQPEAKSKTNTNCTTLPRINTDEHGSGVLLKDPF
jgi:hypothetical protein